MPDQPSDVVDRRGEPFAGGGPSGPAVSEAEIPAPRGRGSAGPAGAGARRQRRTDWRLGGSTVRRWRGMMLAWAVLSLGAGLVLGFTVVWFLPTAPWSSAASTAILWVSMAVPVVVAMRRSRPVGLLRLRPIDLLYGVALGGLLRMGQGAIATAAGQSPSFPTVMTIDGRLPEWWWATDAVPAVLVAPVVEEFFFRAVILIAVYSALRRPIGAATAGLVAALASTGLFILVHAVGGTLTLDVGVAICAVGLTCSLLVLLTGRIWGAVLVHAVYNATFIALALAGALAG